MVVSTNTLCKCKAIPLREGDAVAMTPEGIDRDGMGYGIVKDKPRTGFVVGFTRCGRFVRVKRTGESEVGNYFPESWQRIGGLA